jgi:hypothetical protein
MTLRRTHEDAVLTAEEITVIRQALAACSNVLTWAGQHAGPQFREIVAEITQAAGRGRSPSGLAHDVNLAIDYLDFAPAARGRR